MEEIQIDDHTADNNHAMWSGKPSSAIARVWNVHGAFWLVAGRGVSEVCQPVVRSGYDNKCSGI